MGIQQPEVAHTFSTMIGPAVSALTEEGRMTAETELYGNELWYLKESCAHFNMEISGIVCFYKIPAVL